MVKMRKHTIKRLINIIAILLCLIMLIPIIINLFPQSSATGAQNGSKNLQTLPANTLEKNAAKRNSYVPATAKGPYEIVGIDSGEVLHVATEKDKFLYARLSGIDAMSMIMAGTADEINAAETTYNYLRELIAGKQIYLEEQINEGKIPNEMEAFVYLDDGTFLNLAMVKAGYARTSSPIPDKVKDLFEAAQAQAKRNGDGLWATLWKE